ncbi:MAG: type III-A CRISPR-associated protein Csm2 [Candidatus Ancillula sp.]|jgi:CRISPR-associated protein Csm2|nr:type III-A CRISPR-associated protein Csm2 [Candidatus Ancillula sp.]
MVEWFIDEKYVDQAEKVIKSLEGYRKGGIRLTTSQIRNLLSLTSALYDRAKVLSSEELAPDIRQDLEYLRIQFVYQVGRDNDSRRPTGVKDFVEKAEILEVLKMVNSKATLIRFTRYMESLVAYHKFNGGKD